MPSFNDFSLQSSTRAVLANMNITEPTPIQAEAIPALLAGNDLVGQSATGSGKTLAYGIPLIERLARDKRVTQALVLVPTRELAVQVNTVLSRLATTRRLSTALLVGGRPYGNQISALRYGAQIVVGTPGRVKDHIERGSLVLNNVRICVLDEADQMLDIGFAPIIEEILTTTPDTRQTALFSATMPDWIVKLQEKFLKNPVKVNIKLAKGEQSTIEQIAYQVPQEKKIAALCTLLHSSEGESSLIFGRTKYGVEKLGKHLTRLGYTVGTLHGDKSQRAREDVLTAFRHGRLQTLLATNVAARGLDITGIYQVINFELPESSELFTHRIGRTGRMGRQGKAITLLAPSDVPKWRRMSSSLGQAVSLQRLTINEDASLMPPLAASEVAVAHEDEQGTEAVRGRRQFSRDDQGPESVRDRQQFSRDERSAEAVRGRRQFSRDQERGRPEQVEYENRRPARSMKTRPQEYSAAPMRTPAPAARRQPESVASVAPMRTRSWEPEGAPQPERPYAGRARDGRRTGRAAGKPVARTTAKRNVHTSFPATSESQDRPARRNPRMKTAKQVRQAATTRSVSR